MVPKRAISGLPGIFVEEDDEPTVFVDNVRSKAGISRHDPANKAWSRLEPTVQGIHVGVIALKSLHISSSLFLVRSSTVYPR